MTQQPHDTLSPLSVATFSTLFSPESEAFGPLSSTAAASAAFFFFAAEAPAPMLFGTGGKCWYAINTNTAVYRTAARGRTAASSAPIRVRKSLAAQCKRLFMELSISYLTAHVGDIGVIKSV